MTFEKPKLLPPEVNWLAKFDSSQVNLPKGANRTASDLGHQAIIHCEAWINLMRRRNSQLGEEGGWRWQKNSKSWRLLKRVADLVRPSATPHTAFAPPALQGGGDQRPCSSLKEVRQWSEANEIDEQAEWKRGNAGLEFRCQLNTPTLDRLRQLESLCVTNQAARLRNTLIDQQDLIRLRVGGYAKNGFRTPGLEAVGGYEP